MNKQLTMSMSFLCLLIPPLHATAVTQRALITGGRSDVGKCAIQVNVDAAAEVEVSGDTGILRTLSGQTAVWRRFQCSQPLPASPDDFRLVRIVGRGRMRLLRDPRSNRGSAVVHIEDRKSGRADYTLELQWRVSRRGGWPPPPLPYPPGPYPGPGGFPVPRAMQLCQDAVTNRLNIDGYPYVTFERTIPDDNPGPNTWIVGSVTGRRGPFEITRFSFYCSVDLQSSKVRSVDIRRR